MFYFYLKLSVAKRIRHFTLYKIELLFCANIRSGLKYSACIQMHFILTEILIRGTQLNIQNI